MVTGNSKFHIKNRLLLKNVFSMKYQKYLISQVHKQRQQGHGKKYWNMHIKITFLINLVRSIPHKRELKQKMYKIWDLN